MQLHINYLLFLWFFKVFTNFVFIFWEHTFALMEKQISKKGKLKGNSKVKKTYVSQDKLKLNKKSNNVFV